MNIDKKDRLIEVVGLYHSSSPGYIYFTMTKMPFKMLKIIKQIEPILFQNLCLSLSTSRKALGFLMMIRYMTAGKVKDVIVRPKAPTNSKIMPMSSMKAAPTVHTVNRNMVSE